jgi:two-component system nitrate/nitrite response regulator NarL
VIEAATYSEALGCLGEAVFDIAFLDIDLKGEKSGIDVLRHVREAELDTRAIMLSAHSERDIVMECIGAGASGFILKDTDTDGIFRHALDTIFGGSIFLPPNVIGRGGFSPVSPNRTSSLDSMGLTARSVEVLYYLCQGLPNKLIAKKMEIEEGTIRKDYVPKLFRAFNVARRTELLVEVARRGLVLPIPPRATV